MNPLHRLITIASLALAATAGAFSGAVAQTGVQFDGTNDHVTFGTAPSLGSATFTIECWFRRTGAGVTTTTGTGGVTNAIPLVTKGRGEGEASTVDMNWFLGIRASDNVLIADYEEGTGQLSPGLNHPVAGVTPVRNNVWYHAAATFDGTAWNLYLNGKLDGTAVVGAGRLPQSASIQHAGLGSAFTSVGLAAGFFAGTIDEPRVWNVARSQAQIEADAVLELGSGSGLVGRWDLNEGGGTAAANSVGGGPNGTLTNGPTWVTGSPFRLADALAFNGSSDFVTFGDPAALDLAQFTVECWFRRDAAGVAVSTGGSGVTAVPLVTHGAAEADGTTQDMNWFLGIRSSDGVLAADFEEGSGGASPGLNHPVAGVTPVGTGVWRHAAVAYDGTTWRLYLDGLLETTLAVGQPVQSGTIQHAGLATALTSTGTAAGFLAGLIDEARVWNYARSTAEIQADINAEITAPTTGLVARWALDEAAGTVVNGTAGTTVNGTVTGTGWAWTQGAPFNIVIAPPTPPADPTGLAVAALSHQQVQLTWADNSTNETQFEIERSTAGIGGPFTPHATAPAGATLYDDPAVAPLTEYCYRVRAVNGAGQSNWTGAACATTPAEPNNGIDLAGTDAYVTFGAAPGLGSATFTIECWFRRDGTGATASTGTGGVVAIPLVTRGRGEAEATTQDMNWFLGIRGSDNVLCADFEEGAAGGSPGLNHPVAGVTAITSGVWHHAAATYDGSEWRLYLDGDLEATLVVGQPPRFDSIQHAAIGSALNSTGVANGFFDGVVDEVRVWNAARTRTQIRSLINTQLASPPAGLIGRWALNQSIGTAVPATIGPAGTVIGAGFTWGSGTPFGLVFTHTITASAGPNGGIAPNGAVIVAEGQDQLFTLTPSTGYSVATLIVDAVSIAPATSHTFFAVDADHAIAATFADLTGPAAAVDAPNGGETLFITGTANLQWTATDGVGVTAVDLHLSRSGPSGPWETIALGVANSGSYPWTVTGPAVLSDAYLRVVAHDAAANAGEDVSDQAFSILDFPVPTLVSLFSAEMSEGGLLVRWRLSEPELWTTVRLERAPGGAGPWSEVTATPRREGDVLAVLDASVEYGHTYHYRLLALGAGGWATFGPVEARAGAPVTAFELGAPSPNPSNGPVRITFALPRPTNVRIAVYDLQGRQVARLVEGSHPGGRYTAEWDGGTGGGRAPAGWYLMRMSADGRHWVRRVALTR